MFVTVVWLLTISFLNRTCALAWCEYLQAFPEPELLIYNRIQKTGSTSVLNARNLSAKLYELSDNANKVEFERYINKSGILFGHFGFQEVVKNGQYEYIGTVRNCKQRYESFFHSVENRYIWNKLGT